MTLGRLGSSFVALAAVLAISCAVLAHLTIAEGFSPALGAFLSLLPLAALISWAARSSKRPRMVPAALALAAIGIWLGWDELERHFPRLFFVEHAGGNLALAIVFGRTLAPGREPLCTRFARLLHGGMPAGVSRYTRHVTLAWTVFFAAMFVLSCALYLGGFVPAWSLFASILTPLLVGGMFVVEYAIRLRALPEVERLGILGGIRAFSQHLRTPRIEATR